MAIEGRVLFDSSGPVVRVGRLANLLLGVREEEGRDSGSAEGTHRNLAEAQRTHADVAAGQKRSRRLHYLQYKKEWRGQELKPN